MTRFVVDAYAWIEYLEDSEKGKRVATIVENESIEIFTSTATIAEVMSKFLRKNKDVKVALDCTSTMSTIVNLTEEIAHIAAYIHSEAKKKSKDFGLLDAFVAATAKKFNAKILTGDKHFKNFKDAIII